MRYKEGPCRHTDAQMSRRGPCLVPSYSEIDSPRDVGSTSWPPMLLRPRFTTHGLGATQALVPLSSSWIVSSPGTCCTGITTPTAS